MKRSEPKIYVINLDRQPQRFERIADLLSGSGIPLIRVPAVDGRRLCDAMSYVRRPAKAGALPSANVVLNWFELAIVLSHRRTWRRFLRSGDARAVVLEDDVYFGAGFAEFIRSPSLEQADFDLIKIETLTSMRVLVDSRKALRIGDRCVVRLRSAHMGAAGYILTRRAAERLLTLSAGAPVGADSILFDLDRYWYAGLEPLRIGQVDPAIVVQHDCHPERPNNSLLRSVKGPESNRRSGREKPSFRKVLRELRRPFRNALSAWRERTIAFR